MYIMNSFACCAHEFCTNKPDFTLTMYSLSNTEFTSNKFIICSSTPDYSRPPLVNATLAAITMPESFLNVLYNICTFSISPALA